MKYRLAWCVTGPAFLFGAVVADAAPGTHGVLSYPATRFVEGEYRPDWMKIRPPPPISPELLFTLLDRNRDHVLSFLEFAGTDPFWNIGKDANGDGVLQLVEFIDLNAPARTDDKHMAVAERQAARQLQFDQLDQNRDGHVDKEEALAPTRNRFAEKDLDKSGKLEKAEYLQTLEPVPTAAPATQSKSRAERRRSD